jgi:hypothetical protein
MRREESEGHRCGRLRRGQDRDSRQHSLRDAEIRIRWPGRLDPKIL